MAISDVKEYAHLSKFMIYYYLTTFDPSAHRLWLASRYNCKHIQLSGILNISVLLKEF